MPGSTELLCDRCPFTQELSTVLACYRLSQREAIPIFAELAWCHACRRVVQAEKFVGVEEIRQELLRTGDWLPFSLDRYGEGEWVHLEYWLSRVDSKCLNSARTAPQSLCSLATFDASMAVRTAVPPALSDLRFDKTRVFHCGGRSICLRHTRSPWLRRRNFVQGLLYRYCHWRGCCRVFARGARDSIRQERRLSSGRFSDDPVNNFGFSRGLCHTRQAEKGDSGLRRGHLLWKQGTPSAAFRGCPAKVERRGGRSPMRHILPFACSACNGTSRKPASFLDAFELFSLSKASNSIWRTRSLLTPNILPISCRLWTEPSTNPKRRRRIVRSR